MLSDDIVVPLSDFYCLFYVSNYIEWKLSKYNLITISTPWINLKMLFDDPTKHYVQKQQTFLWQVLSPDHRLKSTSVHVPADSNYKSLDQQITQMFWNLLTSLPQKAMQLNVLWNRAFLREISCTVEERRELYFRLPFGIQFPGNGKSGMYEEKSVLHITHDSSL